MTALRHCTACGWWLRAGSLTEELHAGRCGKAKRQRRAPPIERKPHGSRGEQRQELAIALEYEFWQDALIEATGLSLAQLHRAASGCSELSRGLWRRIAELLEGAP